MQEVDKNNFEEEVLQAEGVVMVDFFSPNCEPCNELKPEIEDMAEKYKDKMKFCALDISKNRRLAINQKVLNLPTIVFYKDGEKISTLTGEDLEAEEIEDEVKKHI
ncbi:thioredoxin TrxA [Natranaerobius thermophilus]|uniref:Thioredoxin n=1 Tax=Natranaerobius thermophilus (strain ATCC BAA-1301 / DSM 18059 / JW/NM-WN-LF) TaxID=457570 RepID=B2A5X4_NATTJ|nr:thioredoxin domain-containing protein [Natranaerobius thermophilus]ACB84067.1 Thioredoxin domain [Natranaerobius thermophilus JW/NM-WN-LF]